MVSTVGIESCIFISPDNPIVNLRLATRQCLGTESYVWMTLDELRDLRDRCQVAIHVLRERAES